jgi:putative hydrolase of the HAD superfamily
VAVPNDDAQVDEIYGDYLRRYGQSIRAFDDARGALTRVRDLGLRVAVLTNGPTEQQTAKLARVGLGDTVGPVFTAEALGVAKPAAETFLLGCQQLALSPTEVVYVADDQVADVQGARNAELWAVHLDREDIGPRSEQPRITSLATFPTSRRM